MTVRNPPDFRELRRYCDEMTATFLLCPIDRANAEALRIEGGIHYTADEKPGYPCRQCLRDAEIGDELLLVSYDPFEQDSPYHSRSPIFLHAHDCGEPTRAVDSESLPDQLTGRTLSVRAFDPEEMMIDAAVIDGKDLAPTLSRFFDNNAVTFVHIHNASRGCYATGVRRG